MIGVFGTYRVFAKHGDARHDALELRKLLKKRTTRIVVPSKSRSIPFITPPAWLAINFERLVRGI
ncbi:MAG TPA: hypothetical protein VJH89_01780, partial [Patescibacteria group bacterium]|nr:hypothetical protein [Patescibacteria group bacterium]